MENALTLEEEISQRRETVENALNCINSFLDSVNFYIKKLYLNPSQDPATNNQDLNLKLFEFIEAEAMRAVEKAAQITQISSNTLLPVTYVDPYSVIFLAVSHLTALQYEKCNIIEEDRLINLCRQIRSKASDLRLKPVKRSRAEVEEIFLAMKKRYYQDNHEALECYRNEYDNLKSDLHDLHDNFQDCKVVAIYKQCERCIVKSLSAMVEGVCTEQDLLQLLAYIIRFEILHEEKQKPAMATQDQDEPLINELKPIFFGRPDVASTFLTMIKGAKPTQVVNTVNSMIKERKASKISCGTTLWKILNDNGLYPRSLSNWNSFINL